jgi:hypothetical protein
VRAAEDHGVDAGVGHGVEVLVRCGQHRVAHRLAPLDELDEARTGLRHQRHVRCRRERVVVRHRGLRDRGADHPDPVVAGGGHGPPHRRPDHLDHRDRVALPGVAQHRGAGGVAGDHEHLHAALDEVVQALEGVLTHRPDRLRPVRLPGGVAEVEHRLVRELVEHRPGHGQSAEARVEDADRGVAHRGLGSADTSVSCTQPSHW